MPRSIIVVADATFFSRNYGVLIFREPNLKYNLAWREIYSETADEYKQLKDVIEKQGFNIQAVILDGKRGVRSVFSPIPVQMCQFHQVAIVQRYLTKKPILLAGKELQQIALQLKNSDEKQFIDLLNNWHAKWHEFLQDKTVNESTGKWNYTHRRIRAAYRSLTTNLPYLFTYLKYPELNIPNTCNSLDGSNTTLKSLLRLHQGLNQKNRYKMICQILSNSYP